MCLQKISNHQYQISNLVHNSLANLQKKIRICKYFVIFVCMRNENFLIFVKNSAFCVILIRSIRQIRTDLLPSIHRSIHLPATCHPQTKLYSL